MKSSLVPLRVESPRLLPLLSELPEVLVHSRADRTVTSYFSVYSTWKRWAISFGVRPLPAEPLTFGLYLLAKIQNGDSYAVCKSALYGVKHIHKMNLVADPTSNDLVIGMLEAAKRLDNHTIHRKEPITVEILRRLFYNLMGPPQSLGKVRTMCMCILGFAGFLRFDELSNITNGDLAVFDTHMTIFIEKAKTDQYREGRTVYISRSESDLCPVAITIAYMHVGGIKCESSESDDLGDTFLFRGLIVSKNGEKLRKVNKPISYTRVREILIKELGELGLNPKQFGTHSLRAGGASAAANAGVPDRLFKRHGRWVSETAKDGYVKDNVARLLIVTQSLGL